MTSVVTDVRARIELEHRGLSAAERCLIIATVCHVPTDDTGNPVDRLHLAILDARDSALLLPVGHPLREVLIAARALLDAANPATAPTAPRPDRRQLARV